MIARWPRVTAGIDMALALTERVHGRALAESLQLVIEYYPQPPFDSGSLRGPARARAAIPEFRVGSTGTSLMP